jgi:hypothetical protein
MADLLDSVYRLDDDEWARLYEASVPDAGRASPYRSAD